MTLMFEALKRIEARSPASHPPLQSPLEAASQLVSLFASDSIAAPMATELSTEMSAAMSPEVIDQIDTIQQLVAISTGYGASIDANPSMPTYSPRMSEADWSPETQIEREEIPTIYPIEEPSLAQQSIVQQGVVQQSSMQRNSAQPALSIHAPYADLAREIYDSLPHDHPHLLGFTSPGQDHGATTVAFNVACSLTDISTRSVLVLDGNFKNADMSHRSGRVARFGLDEVLRGAIPWREILQPTGTPRMSLLPIASSRAEGLNAAQRRALPILLNELGGSFGLLVIDAGSLADPHSLDLLAACEMTYLTVRLGHASARMLRESQRVLRRRGAWLAGTVVVG